MFTQLIEHLINNSLGIRKWCVSDYMFTKSIN